MFKTITEAVVRVEFEKMKTVLEQGKLPDVAAQIQQELDLVENATLAIAITGHTGSGKSSLVNALRGMSDFDAGAAEVGVEQTTMIAKEYQHPTFPKVKIWDLPGIGSPEFKAKEYLKEVNFSKYDFFIIVSERFTENDVQLAREIQKMKKKFYFVRSKTDISIAAESRRPMFNETETLERLRKHNCAELKKLGESSPRVFLISSWNLSMYDFPVLQGTLQEELDDLKRVAFLLSVPTFSRDILKKKKNEMEKLIWKLAWLSCFIGAVPVPGLSLVCDIAILVVTLKIFCKSFGLDEDSLHGLANRVGKPVSELKSVIKKSPLANEIRPEFVVDLLKKSVICATLTAIELLCDFLPVLGSLVGGAGSFITTFYMLKSFLKDVEEDAENVRAKASERLKSSPQ